MASKTDQEMARVLKHSSLDRDKLRVEITNSKVFALARKMNDWEKIYFGEKLTEAILGEIKKDAIDEDGRRRTVLTRWKELYGHEATYEQLLLRYVESGRMDLADLLCKEYKKQAEETAGEITYTKAFTSNAQPQEDVGIGNNRDIPLLQGSGVENISPRLSMRSKTPIKAVEEESDSLSCKPVQSDTPTSTEMPLPTSHTTNPPIMVSGRESEPTKSTIQSFLAASIYNLTTMQIRTDDNQKKKDVELKTTVEVLKLRQSVLQGYMTENEAKIDEIQAEKTELERVLNEERGRNRKAKEDSIKKQQKIDQLEGDVYQKRIELKLEKDDKEETCEQLREQLKQAHAQLEQANSELEAERKEIAEARVRQLESEVATTKQEKTHIEVILDWMENDLAEEKKKLKNQKGCTVFTVAFLCSFFIVIIAIFYKWYIYYKHCD